MTHQMTRSSDLPPPVTAWLDDDVAVLRAAAAGDVPAQERLWRVHMDAVYRICRSQLQPHDADDAMVETFVQAFASGQSFDPARGTVRAWLLGIAVHQVRRRYRADRRIAGTLSRLRVRERDDATGDDHADEVIARADATSIRAALAQLGDGDREVLVTQAAGDLSPDELGAAFGISSGAAKVRLHRARRRLAGLVGPAHDPHA